MRDMRFIVTEELGKLAKWLRILGYDCVYYSKKDISGLIIQALREKRVLVTRSSAFTKFHGIRIIVSGSDFVEEQLDELTRELDLPLDDSGIFRICVECNTPLEDIKKEEVRDRVPEYVYNTQDLFKRCPVCDKIFWKGTHWGMVKEWLERSRL